MEDILNRIEGKDGKPILVIGDLMVDEYFWGRVDRISPEAPVPVVRETKREWSLGGAANVALNIKKLGCDVSVVGLIGSFDIKGQKFLELLEDEGISSEGIVKSCHRTTTTKKRILVGINQLLRLDTEDDYPMVEEDVIGLFSNLRKLAKENSVILVSDYAKGVITPLTLAEIRGLASERNCIVVVDPRGADYGKYFGVDYLKPNFNEYGEMIKYFKLDVDDSIEANGKKICELMGLKGLLVTLGEKGMQFVSAEESFFLPAHKQEVFNLTGAGDTVLAFWAVGLSRGLSVKDSLMLANKAAAISVSHLNTYAVTFDDIRRSDSHNTSSKIVNDWKKLHSIVEDLRRRGNRIVLTNGSFDLLHSGHIYLLEEAKKQGDVLVVAINTDASVRRYKGPGRPIKPLEDRQKVIAAIGVVDFVVSFNQDTPYELISLLKPDVLVKGGDYKVNEIVGHDIVLQNGGTVFVAKYQDGFSTTNIIKAAVLKSRKNNEFGAF